MALSTEIITRDEIIAFLERHPNGMWQVEDGSECIVNAAICEKYGRLAYVNVGYDYIAFRRDNNDHIDDVYYDNPLWLHDWQDKLRRMRDDNGYVLGVDALKVLGDYPEFARV